MSTTDYAGIDYGLGQTNVDKDKGIRYGVISQNLVLQAWADSSEPDYGEPEIECECGEFYAGKLEDLPEHCEKCGEYFNTDCLEPVGFFYDNEGIKAYAGEDGDIFITESPYFTYAQFCSPCAPGACYLANPLSEPNEANKAYCFPADWFDSENPCPYPVYSVATGKLVTENES